MNIAIDNPRPTSGRVILDKFRMILISKRKEDEMVTTIRLPEELHKKLKREAEQKGMTFNAYVLILLWGLEKKKDS